MFRSGFPILCSPNEDFGKRNSGSGVCFRGTLRGCEYSIWATSPRKVPRKDTPDALFRFPKSSFGRHKFFVRGAWIFVSASEKNQHIASHVSTIFCIILQSLCSRNEDVGRPMEHSGTHFQLPYATSPFFWTISSIGSDEFVQ